MMMLLRRCLLCALGSAFLAASVAPLAWGEGAEAPLIDLEPRTPVQTDPAGGKPGSTKKNTRRAPGSTGTTKSGNTTTRRLPPKEPKGAPVKTETTRKAPGNTGSTKSGNTTRRQPPKEPKGTAVKTETTRKPTKMTAEEATFRLFTRRALSDVNEVRALLAAGADVKNAYNYWGSTTTVLLEAVRDSDTQSPEVIRALLDAGADANARDKYNMTVLMKAVYRYRPNPDVVRALIAAGADVNAQSSGSVNTALSLAAFDNQHLDAEVVKILLAAGADVNAGGGKALISAAIRPIKELDPQTGNAAPVDAVLATMRALLDAGADVNARGPHLAGIYRDMTVLMVASMKGHPAVVKMLLDAGADVNIKHEKRGGTALSYAKMRGNTEAAALLRAAGATE